MYSVLICTHYNVAGALVESAVHLRGKSNRLDSIGIFPEDSMADIAATLEQKIRHLKQYGDVVVLSDMVLGTPFNVLIKKTVDYEIKHISGVNLPLVLSLMEYCAEEGTDTGRAVKAAIEAAKASLVDAEELIRR